MRFFAFSLDRIAACVCVVGLSIVEREEGLVGGCGALDGEDNLPGGAEHFLHGLLDIFKEMGTDPVSIIFARSFQLDLLFREAFELDGSEPDVELVRAEALLEDEEDLVPRAHVCARVRGVVRERGVGAANGAVSHRAGGVARAGVLWGKAEGSGGFEAVEGRLSGWGIGARSRRVLGGVRGGRAQDH